VSPSRGLFARAVIVASTAGALIAAPGCKRHLDAPDAGASPAASRPIGASPSAASAGSNGVPTNASANGALLAASVARGVAFDFLTSVDQCSFGRRGPLLDFGETGLRVRGAQGEELSPERVEREGASFARVRARSITVPFYVGAEEEKASGDEPTTVTLRLRGVTAKTMAVFVNGKSAGTIKLAKGETKLVSVAASSPLLNAGLNELTLRFHAPPRTEREIMAEIDWAYLAPGELEPHFAAPTVRDVILDRALGGRLEKVFALRGGTSLRCMGFLPNRSTLELDLASEGAGEVEVEARLLRDRMPAAVLGRATVSGTFTPQRFPLATGPDAGVIGAIELAVVRAPKGSRALFGQPRVVVPPPAARPSPAPMRGVVLVVLGTVEPKTLVPYGGALGTAALARLAREGTVFSLHRSASTLANAALASMLAGRGPRSLRLDDGDARLPSAVTTIADAARQAGVVTAYFTGNPMTTAAHGFDRSWETQAAFLPDVDPGGVRPFDEAAAWLRARKDERFLLVVHARGGHPPWSITPEDLKTMAPPNYSGGLDPKHAGELLSKARHVPPLLRFTDADRTRAFALHASAFADQDKALARLVDALRSGGLDKHTLVLVTGDVGVSTAVNVPFGDGEPPSEELLATPLIATGAGLFPAGAVIGSPTVSLDIGKTVLGALGLAPPASFEGVDLADVAAAPALTLGRSQFASVLGHHSLRWGSLVLESSDRRDLLCDVGLEPLCTTDVRPTHPLALLVLGRRLAQEKSVPSVGGAPREQAVVDARTQAALRAWGR
jgi:arylsulfatase A-like enzyme